MLTTSYVLPGFLRPVLLVAACVCASLPCSVAGKVAQANLNSPERVCLFLQFVFVPCTSTRS